MKKIVSFGSLLFAITLVGCAGDTTTSSSSTETNVSTQESTTEASSTQPQAETNAAIVYYSLTGNTDDVAQAIEAETDADLYQIETTEPYPEAYNDVSELVQQQMDAGEFPEINELSINLAEYDVVYVGSPIWFGDISLPVQSWLQETDLTGKTIMPFFTSGSSSINSSMQDLETLAEGATVQAGLGISDAARDNLTEEVQEWLANGQA